MTEATAPTTEQISLALYTLADRTATRPALVSCQAEDQKVWLPHARAVLSPAIRAIFYGHETATAGQIIAGMTDAYTEVNGLTTDDAAVCITTRTYGKLLGVWTAVVVRDYNAAPDAPESAVEYADTVLQDRDAAALAAVRPAPAVLEPEPAPAGPLTDEKAAELIAAGIMTPDYRLARNGVAIEPPADLPPRRHLVIVGELPRALSYLADDEDQGAAEVPGSWARAGLDALRVPLGTAAAPAMAPQPYGPASVLDAAWRDCGHRADYASAAEHQRDCPAHGIEYAPGRAAVRPPVPSVADMQIGVGPYGSARRRRFVRLGAMRAADAIAARRALDDTAEHAE